MNLVSDFCSLFGHTTNSYKYLFLKSILKQVDQGYTEISINEIVLDQLVYAWYPNQYFKLSFGLQDKISNIYKEQNFTYSSEVPITSALFDEKLRLELQTSIDPEAIKRLTVYVQYRLLSPFFSEELRGKPDHVKNNMIAELSHQTYDIRKPLYRINKAGSSIEIHPDWVEFIRQYGNLLTTYLESEWVGYLQKHNPSIPGVIYKTAPPKSRDSLSRQTKYWIDFLHEQPDTECIYSKQKLLRQPISIDHFLPWSFVCHDRIWNLVPTSTTVNSKKSNTLPSIERYLDKFVQVQHKALVFHSIHNKQWDKVSAELIHDLGFSSMSELLSQTEFEEKLSINIANQHRLAQQLGFASDWVFN
jgi:hypothetical protein